MAVEAALVVMLLAGILLALVETAFAVRDYASVSSLSRTGVRIASTGAGDGDALSTSCGIGDADLPPCAPSTTPQLAQMAADAVQHAGSAMAPDQINYLLVYKANASGMPGTQAAGSAMPTSCRGIANCVMFVWDAAANGFRWRSGYWDSARISACFPGTATSPLDSVGVYLNADSRPVTGFFGDGITMGSRAVMRFEPLPYETCGQRLRTTP
ncbi:TadE/TadG family type IV pilus assembly protein [Nocardioides marmoraquaticus]